MNLQLLCKDCFYRRPDTFDHCNKRPEELPETCIDLNHSHDETCQGKGRIASSFEQLTKDDILHLPLTQEVSITFIVKDVDAFT